MASTYKTNALKLNEWVESDIPDMEDFNSDNAILENAISTHHSDADIHITSGERKKWNNVYGLKTYTGNGKSTQSIKLGFGFKPRFCIVFAVDSPPGVIDIANDTHYNYFGIASVSGSNSGLKLDGETLTVTSSSVMIAKYEMRSYNELSRTFLVIGFR